MKKQMLFLIGLIAANVLLAQAPQGISHQAVIRDANNELVANSQIGIQVSILQGSSEGEAVYVEMHTPVSNANGLISYIIGEGDAAEGQFAEIDWSAGPYFLKTEADPMGGTDYTITGITQFHSVPYALHAQTADNLTYEIEETDPVFSAWDKSEGITITESQITDFGEYVESETDPLFTASPASGILSGEIENWDEAFSWGDHGEEGYLKSETDPTWSGSSNQTGNIGRTGNVGIGTTSPNARLHVHGGIVGGNVLFTGPFLPVIFPGDPPASGQGTRMMWYPDKAAFRAGRVTGDQWDKANIGFFSLATGYATIASGKGSVAIGYELIAKSAYETVVGSWNEDYTPNATISWDASDRLFVIGNGTSDDNRSNAMTVLKDGSVGIGSSAPDAQLHTTGSVRFEGAGEPGAGKVLTSDPSGHATWEAPFAMPTGSNMQTLRHDGTSWIADDLLRNNGAGLGIGEDPRANTQLFVRRPSGAFGAGHASIYASRPGDPEPAHGGVSWSLNNVDAAIISYSNWGNNFSAAVAGYGFLDYANSAAVIGSIWGGGMYGALAFKDANNDLWAGYFNGNVNIAGTLRIQGGSPGEGKVLTSDASGAASWQSATVAVGSALSCIDIDGNAYPTIVIGNQVWMAENLRVTKYKNGDPIPNVNGYAAWGALETGAYCWYENDQSANAKYGALYNWYAVDDPRGLCPEGWRVPTDAEWTAFTVMLGGAGVAGGKLKAVSPLWNDPNTNATNSTGFSALPGGNRWSSGSFHDLGTFGFWWSATEDSGTDAWLRSMPTSLGNVYRFNYSKRSGVSVRCLRDID